MSDTFLKISAIVLNNDNFFALKSKTIQIDFVICITKKKNLNIRWERILKNVYNRKKELKYF